MNRLPTTSYRTSAKTSVGVVARGLESAWVTVCSSGLLTLAALAPPFVGLVQVFLPRLAPMQRLL